MVLFAGKKLRSWNWMENMGGQVSWHILATKYVTFVTFQYQLGGSIQGCFPALCSSFFLWSLVRMPWQIVEGLEVNRHELNESWTVEVPSVSCRRWSSRSKIKILEMLGEVQQEKQPTLSKNVRLVTLKWYMTSITSYLFSLSRLAVWKGRGFCKDTLLGHDDFFHLIRSPGSNPWKAGGQNTDGVVAVWTWLKPKNTL